MRIANIELFPWHELTDKVHAMASNTSSGYIGLTVEILKFNPIEATYILLSLVNGILAYSQLLNNWKTIQFIMIAKHIKATTNG